MAGGAGEAVLVEAAIDLGILGESAGKHADGVVAAIAMTGEFDAFGAQKNIHAGAVKRRAEGVGVQGLTPLAVGLLMTTSAVGSGQEGIRLDKGSAVAGGVAGRGDFAGAKVEVIGLGDLIGVGLASVGLLGVQDGEGQNGGNGGDNHRLKLYPGHGAPWRHYCFATV